MASISRFGHNLWPKYAYISGSDFFNLIAVSLASAGRWLAYMRCMATQKEEASQEWCEPLRTMEKCRPGRLFPRPRYVPEWRVFYIVKLREILSQCIESSSRRGQRYIKEKEKCIQKLVSQCDCFVRVIFVFFFWLWVSVACGGVFLTPLKKVDSSPSKFFAIKLMATCLTFANISWKWLQHNRFPDLKKNTMFSSIEFYGKMLLFSFKMTSFGGSDTD